MKNLILTLVACLSFWSMRADVQFSYVNPETHEIRIRNYSLVDVDISSYRLCALFQYVNLSQPAVTVLSGDFNLAPTEEVSFTWNPGGGFNTTASDLGLYLPTGSFAVAANMVDFMQYGAGGQGRENVAVAAGMWNAGTFLLTPGPWYYVGGNPSMINTWAYDPDYVDVTFRVDMTQQTVSPDGVFVVGSFQGWDFNAGLMYDFDTDGIYEYTGSINFGANVQYKFINGNNFSAQESVPASCGVDDGFGGFNRNFDITSVIEPNITLDVVCFGECQECQPIVEPHTVDVTFNVNMQNETVSANGVHIAGNFQGWDASSSEMTDVDGDGIYTITLAIDTNYNALYTFINGNTYAGQESVPSTCGADNGFGGYNRTAAIGETDLVIDAVCFGECADCEPIVEPLTVNVTFNVNMQNETVSANGVHIAGNFQGYDPASSEMTDLDDDGIYSITLAIDTNYTALYTFINGNTYGQQESVPSTCGVDNGFGGYNRTAAIGETDLVIDAFCFGECADCEPIVEPVTVNVTFNVNMQNETVSANGVHIAGNFQGYDPASSEMTDLDGDGIYSITLAIDTNYTALYTFINGNTYGQQEAVPSTCGVDNGFGGYNRTAAIGETDLVIDAVCFGECADCEPIVEPLTVNVTFNVNMQNETVSANGVHIAGNFQGYDPASSEMTDLDGDGIYSITLAIDTNYTALYTFINGNTYGQQESVPSTCGVDNGFGGYNRTAAIGETDLVIDAVCFGECADCEPIVEPVTVNVTFNVNMQNETVSTNGVHIAGNFQGYDPASSEMTDIDGDGIYSITLAIDTNYTALYTFINGNTYGQQESVPSTCGVDNGFGGYNRTAAIGETDLVIDAVCFGECADCEPIVEPVTVNVTFNVNMQNETVSANGVHIAGNFQGWDASSSTLTDGDGDGIYSITLAIDTNYTALYTFINGNTYAGQESVPSTCGVDNGFGGYNRSLAIGETDLAIDVVCFGECVDCELIVEPLTVNVTFSVNMQNETVSANGVHIAGNFQGWDASSSELTDGDGDGIYSITLAIDTNYTALYTFINGNTYAGQEAVPSECGVDNGFGGYNRSLAIGETDLVIDAVCFGECADCEPVVVPSTVSVTFRVNMLGQIIDPAGVHLLAELPDATTTFMMTDINGDLVYEYTLEVDTNSTLLYLFVNGITFAGEEMLPGACAVPEILAVRREVVVDETDIVLPVVCFGACENCPGSSNMITLQVNMANETVSPDGVHVAGNFQGWDPAATELLDEDGDGIYTVTFESDEWANLSYKFINGNTYAGAEEVPSTCGLPDGNGGYNRILETGSNDVTAFVVCFGECANCQGQAIFVDVTFQVNMANETVDANGVHIAGNIQGFDPAASEMTDDNGDGIYEITLPVETNTVAEFRFINGNDWPLSEVVPAACGIDNGFGQYNRTLAVGTTPLTFGPVCFGACVDCDDIVEPTTVPVTFLVNMAIETPGANGVHIAGSFQNWNPATSEMTDDNADGIYEFTADVPVNTTIQFKFINGNDWPDQESVPAECGVSDGFGGTNRTFDVGSTATTFGPVCFSECVDCLPFQPVLVTFRVDMSNQIVSPEGVYIGGSFNNWTPSETQMSEYETNHYQAVVVLNAGQSVSYKFVNGMNWSGTEVVPSSCGVSDGFGGFNRSFTASDANQTLDLVCFSECSDCVVLPTVDITFQVDMSQQTVDPSGVYIAGSFNGFSASANQMTDQGQSVYSTTINVPANTQVTFKYLNGSSFGGVETVPFECGVDDGFGGFNRAVNVDEADVTLPEVCFSSCVDCPVNVEELGNAGFGVYPNPASDQFFIQLSNSGAEQYFIYDATGKLVMNAKIMNAGIISVDASILESGLYHLVIPGAGTRSLVIE